ncbi:endonuclease/exonuclease/phosphatase family protein [Lentiprolixibacter aurantiacus]|uniref:Endonuclease/exonuclease/phosphatase family protein n=1 Tax=Lentiprolixibacter aurantiacus TaxID=2993939 RepID=A0AAE3MP45_9FLAO|nr:endonuclease/exonuclease/phosphatase family protein [Lentiprolixibacter aurantiacus]MCX2720412.1 endonuclease/exonuclease/phosphatase family protein [Lentiprolixibacter aurantiacus]
MRLASGIRKFFVLLNVAAAFTLLLACYNAYKPIPSLPLVDVIGILVPPLMIINLLFLVFWIWIKKQFALISAISLLVGFWCFGSIYEIQFLKPDLSEKDLSIFSYNVQGFKYWAGKEASGIVSIDILEFISEQDPDVVCFQEYKPVRPELIASYPFRYYTPHGTGRTSQAILSKYPIANGGSLNFPNSGNNAIYADVAYGKDTIRIYNVHLQSYWIYSFRSLIKRNAGKDFMKRLQHTAAKHREQAVILENHRKSSNHPVVYAGDFNQPPYSPSFRRLSEDMKDSFREEGGGWGTTFKRNYISARIDFILADDQAFEVIDHQNFNIRKSDHLPVMARLKYRSN